MSTVVVVAGVVVVVATVVLTAAAVVLAASRDEALQPARRIATKMGTTRRTG